MEGSVTKARTSRPGLMSRSMMSRPVVVSAPMTMTGMAQNLIRVTGFEEWPVSSNGTGEYNRTIGIVEIPIPSILLKRMRAPVSLR